MLKCGTHNDIILLSEAFVTSHTFSLFECFLYCLVPCSTAVRTSSPPCACCLIFTKRRLRYLNIRHQSEHLYTVPVLFYVSKTTDDVYSNLSLSTSLGNVVEFGVPFVCWFCDDDFWGCTLYRCNTVSHIFNSCAPLRFHIMCCKFTLFFFSVLFVPVFFSRPLVVFYYIVFLLSRIAV